MVEETTTIQVTSEVWAALDKRKTVDETFDDYIRRLINNTTMPMGTLKSTAKAPTVETRDVEPVANPPEDASCTHFDSIEGVCENSVAYKQEYRPSFDDTFDTWYWCEEHAPQSEF